ARLCVCPTVAVISRTVRAGRRFPAPGAVARTTSRPLTSQSEWTDDEGGGQMRNGVVVDIGGSGTRIGAVVDGHVVGVHSAEVATAEDLAAAIRAVDDAPAGVGVSLNGRVDADRGEVAASRGRLGRGRAAHRTRLAARRLG